MPHRLFERRGDDLYTNVTISLQVSVEHSSKDLSFFSNNEFKILGCFSRFLDGNNSSRRSQSRNCKRESNLEWSPNPKKRRRNA